MSLIAPLHDVEFYRGDPFPTYQRLRREDPVHWSEEGGFWALARYEDVRFVSIHPELFTSTRGVMIPDEGVIMPEEQELLIFTDPPRHRKLRAVMKNGLTPGQIKRLEPQMRAIAREIVAGIQSGPVFDFAETVAAPLPTVVIARLLGAPEEDWPSFRTWSDAIVGYQDPDESFGQEAAQAALHEYFTQLIEERRREPRDDLLSWLLAAEVDGAKLPWDDVYNFCWLMLIGGNETTRNTIAMGTRALLEHPEQLKRILDDASLIPSAVEEILRWCNPVVHMMRTATRDVELCGRKIREGQRVVMLYGSANRDEAVFGADAEDFDVGRNPNPHIQFGFGEHVCIGAPLARLEARVMFEELVPTLARCELAGDDVRVRSTLIPGIKYMPVRCAA